jgi:hypothetical protein
MYAAWAVQGATYTSAWTAASNSSSGAGAAAFIAGNTTDASYDAIRRSLSDLLDDIAGPDHPLDLPRTQAIVSLAQGIYDQRRWEDLPMLADALEEAGCDNADIPGYLRGSGLHARGCWALDRLIGRE